MARLLSSYCANRSNCIILGNEAKRFLGRQKYEQVYIFLLLFGVVFPTGLLTFTVVLSLLL